MLGLCFTNWIIKLLLNIRCTMGQLKNKVEQFLIPYARGRFGTLMSFWSCIFRKA